MKKITAVELKQKWDNGERFILLDVREDHEVQFANINPHIHIRMMDIPDRLNDLDKDMPIVVMCHGGVRSAQVCHYLDQFGFDTTNLEGGIDSWSKEIDPSVPVY